MSDESSVHSSDDTDEKLLDIEKESSRLHSRDRWVATIRAVEDLLENDEVVLQAHEIKNPVGEDNKDDPPVTTPAQDSKVTPQTSSSITPSVPAPRKEERPTEDTQNDKLDTTGTTSEQNAQDENRKQSKKKVRFTDADTTIPADDENSSAENISQDVRSPQSYRLLRDIKIDLSKLIPASSRFGDRDVAETLPAPFPSPELSFPEPSCSGSSRPVPSFEDLAAIPGPSYADPLLLWSLTTGRYCTPTPFSDKGMLPNRKQLNIQSDDNSSDGPYLKPTESHCLFEGKNYFDDNLIDPVEWDFSDSPINSLTISDKNIPIQYKLKLNDNDMPHIYDPETNLYIPLKNGDKIKVVAEVHPIPKKFRLITENISATPVQPEHKSSDRSVDENPKYRKEKEHPIEVTDRIDVVPSYDNDDEGSLIMQLHDEDFDDSSAPDNPDWSESSSPSSFRERRHSI